MINTTTTSLFYVVHSIGTLVLERIEKPTLNLPSGRGLYAIRELRRFGQRTNSRFSVNMILKSDEVFPTLQEAFAYYQNSSDQQR